MNITKTEIAELLPHSGNMLLIDRVDAWDEHSIRCRSDNHRNPDHPLRMHGHLSALHLVEYGAQAMGIHGALLKGALQAGYLAAVRDVHLMADTLDAVDSSLHIEATALAKSGQGVIYQLHVCDTQHRLLLSARATIIHTGT